MKQEKEVRISYWAAHLTTIVSVTLVLVLAGAIALVWLAGRSETRRLQERLEVTVIMADSISDTVAARTAASIAETPFAQNVSVVSKQKALENWKADTGEDLEALFGVNPLSPEISFTVRHDYASQENLGIIASHLSKMAEVEGVALPDAAMVEAMNENIRKLSFVLGGVALAMLVISFVLINNTVHLSVYSRRFTLHTMQLVGATDGYIRRPYVGNNMLSGLLSGLAACAVLGLLLWLAPSAGLGGIVSAIGFPYLFAVAGGLCLAGALLCGAAAAIATTKYLHRDYNDLFR